MMLREIIALLIVSIGLGATITEVDTITVYLLAKISMVTVAPTASNVPENSPEPTSTFANTILSSHNQKRSLHHSQMLLWNNSLYEYASNFAEQYDCSGTLTHSGGIYGENLAIGYTAEGAVSAWYNEGKTYDYKSANTYSHFTQVIWNSTSQLGCAYKYCGPVWSDYIVCSYYPAGNIVGHNGNNVFPM